MNICVRLLLGVVVWSVASAGCSLTKPQPAVHHYALALQLPVPVSSTATTSLVIHPLTARVPYDQERLVYRTSPYAFDLYNSHRWASSPAEQVTHWTRRYLQATGIFSQVFPTTDGNADIILGGVVRQCEELDHETTWEAALSIDFWLTRANERSPFWFRSYSVTKSASRRNPEAIAEAMSQGLADILQQLTTDISPIVNNPSP
jgi:cholesterol transport system auxiliary component